MTYDIDCNLCNNIVSVYSPQDKGQVNCLIVIYNGLHTSRNVGHHSTVFAFVQGGQNLFLQCWAVHILENGRTDFFFDPSRDLLRQHMTPVNIIFPNGFVAHTVTFERDGRIMMDIDHTLADNSRILPNATFFDGNASAHSALMVLLDASTN
ncbi:uncharacterized protein LACBIDRAFT_328775 [Laccaria bicolor S238N-H82]|uniref:Predicted protein n=1 Tax=Laccaria bicolor (strain S238N-H82 / ATCC MYA-4686) TaxID=486041 RepID=B0DFY3_LACBS|nr:uncharacterized protein LACBIDRAFT_328775 [Laccaria bicolor S238N-H82]EDR06423.1 predicted protein [Laccaria bicolor S238N-H82]|eukprot:XP_001882795.1 predicted protein [Laccaria bicolor S238N-H82]